LIYRNFFSIKYDDNARPSNTGCADKVAPVIPKANSFSNLMEVITMKKQALLAITIAITGMSPAIQAGDAAAGKTKSAACAGCHGANGIAGNKNYPNLAGQNEGYLIKATKDYRDGNRKDPMMASFVKGLSDADIANLSTYYSSLK